MHLKLTLHRTITISGKRSLVIINKLQMTLFCAGNFPTYLSHFSELSLEVQGGQDYFRFVEGTCIIALCLASLSLSVFIRCTQILIITSKAELYLLLINDFSKRKRGKRKHNSTPTSCAFLTFNIENCKTHTTIYKCKNCAEIVSHQSSLRIS